MKRPASLSEIAAQVGVSIATVSRALHRPDLVREETRTAIVSAARKAGYVDADASDPARASATFIGLVVPDIENPFFSVLAKSVLQELRRGGISLIVADTNEDALDEAEIIAAMLPRVEGLIVASSRLCDDDIRTIVAGKPAVLLNRELPGMTSIVIDYSAGSRQAVEHLAALGHVRIAYAEGPPASWSNAQRRESFQAVASDLGLDGQIFGPYTPKFDGGVQAADIAVARGITAIIAYNDLMAFGIMSRLASRGIRVPEQMSVIGFDDVPEASIWSPALSTVNVSIAASGRLGILALLRRIAGNPREGSRRLSSRLVVRGSTAAIAAKSATSLTRA
jgi:LacI family transcriptional regulator